MSKKFDGFRFAGLDARDHSNKYLTMDRVSEDGHKIVVKFAECHVFETAYGYGLIIDRYTVQWLKPWQVSQNWYGTEVLLDEEFFAPKPARTPFDGFCKEEGLTFDYFRAIAREQQEAGTLVKWKK